MTKSSKRRKRSLGDYVKETNRRFWAQTGYKRNQQLDMTDEQDRTMAKVWIAIFHQLQHETNPASGRRGRRERSFRRKG
jgi:hypothetical protein